MRKVRLLGILALALSTGHQKLVITFRFHAQSFVVEHAADVDRSIGWLRQNCKCRS